MEIKCNGYKVIESGRVISWKMEPIEFIFSENFTIRVVVVKNLESSPSVQTRIIDNKILDVEFVNAHVMLNFGTTEPFQIGKLAGNEVYANFSVTVMLEDDNSYSYYQLSYTFYQKEE
jgi:hypothetical protein